MDGKKPNMKARVGLKENVEYVLRHCADCATGSCAYAKAYEEQGLSVPSHGIVKRLFQENSLLRWLLKKEVVSPLWINQWYAKLLMPFFGAFADKRLVSNLITTAGKGGVASRINGSGGEAAFTYIAVGTGTTAAAVGDTALETEIADSGLSRANATASRVTTDTTNDSARLTNTFSVSGTKAVTESGVLNASSGGVLLARQVFSAINVVSGDSLAMTWTIDVD